MVLRDDLRDKSERSKKERVVRWPEKYWKLCRTEEAG